MSTSYRAQVGVALEMLAEGLAPFVDTSMRAQFPDDDWIVTAATRLGKREPALASPTDPQFLLEVMVRWWGPVFGRQLGKETRETIQQLRTARNDWAHIDDTHPIDLAYARRIHSQAEDVLQEIGSPAAGELARLAEDLERRAARDSAREQGVSETDILIRELTDLQSQREALTDQLEQAKVIAETATGRQRAVARQLAELQAQYAAVAGLRERYRELEADLEAARTVGEREAADVSQVKAQLDQTQTALGQLRQESARLHDELDEARERIQTIDPIDTEIGRRWVMLMAAVIMVLGVVIIMAVAIGTTI